MTSLSQPHELGYIYYVEPSYISYGSHDLVPSILQLFNLRLNLDHLPFSFHPGSFDGTRGGGEVLGQAGGMTSVQIT